MTKQQIADLNKLCNKRVGKDGVTPLHRDAANLLIAALAKLSLLDPEGREKVRELLRSVCQEHDQRPGASKLSDWVLELLEL